jgi:hypothetical protein
MIRIGMNLSTVAIALTTTLQSKTTSNNKKRTGAMTNNIFL